MAEKSSTTEYAEQTHRSIWSSIFITLLIIGLIALIAISVYLLTIELVPGSPISLDTFIIAPPVLQNTTYGEVSQFYPNMKFNHKSIAYTIDSLCDETQRKRMIGAFEELASKINSISFYEASQNVDITITCSEREKSGKGDTFIAGEGGAEGIIPTGQYNIITNGTVILHGNPHGFIQCEWPNVEIHELIHVFGFGHSEDTKSLMYPLLENCNQKLDDSIILELNKIYSEENLPDLYFEEVKVVKKRKFLDFNLTVKNSGAVDVADVKLNVYGDGNLISTFDLGDDNGEIKYGAGISISITNLKLNTLNPAEITFEIKAGNPAEEVGLENNIAKITF